MEVKEIAEAIVREVASVLASVDSGEVKAFVDGVLGARTVFVGGEGRSGLIARTFAMRVMQLGLESYVVGETTTPAVQPGDLLVAVSGSGETATTILFAQTAKAHGGRVAAVVASPDTRLGKLADLQLVIPGRAKTGAGMESSQMPGSLFEQAAFMMFDAVVTALVKNRGESYKGMLQRHANIE